MRQQDRGTPNTFLPGKNVHMHRWIRKIKPSPCLLYSAVKSWMERAMPERAGDRERGMVRT